MLRYWSSNQAVYVLSSQLFTYSSNIALEIHKQQTDVLNSYIDVMETWSEFTDSLTTRIKVPLMLSLDDIKYVCLTIMFADGMIVTGGVLPDIDSTFSLGGLPIGTQVYLNGVGYYIGGNDVIYIMQAPDNGTVVNSSKDVNLNH